MSRRHYLITYDISDDKRRTSVFRTLVGQGDHVGDSVAHLTRADDRD